MRELTDSQVKSTVSPKAAITTEGRTLGTATLVGGGGATVCFSVFYPDSLKYTDPDGRMTISHLGGTFSASLFAPDDQYRLMPIGGDLTSIQKDIDKLIGVLSAATGFAPNNFSDAASAFSATSDGDYQTLLETGVGIIAGQAASAAGKSVGNIFTLTQILGAATVDPQTGATNYTSSELAFVAMVSIEQSFSKDLIGKFRENGVSFSTHYMEGTGFIMNVTVLEPVGSGIVNKIINETIKLNPLYNDIQFD
jgi:hypothetical protein